MVWGIYGRFHKDLGKSQKVLEVSEYSTKDLEGLGR
jgi:hypothetical protein